ncbi:MAG: trypsin-like peptidase domain-containing protein [Hormoscilla sp. GM7CHS1pb]|nr:trypsin-like peptidase domain-containing protein [Hormoscilla sp. GM7CHS1pb]
MKLFYKISAAVLGVAATIALVQPQIAVGLSGREVGQVAREITVRIDGPANGSGAIVGKRDNVYTVLTNCHVVKEPGTYTIQTHAGSRYTVNANPSMCQPGGIDLAMLRFTSTRRYRVANLGNSSQLAVGDKVYASGWGDSSRHNLERRYRFRPGDITGRDPQAREGYTLAHTIQTGPGMSGGPILDEQGDVVGLMEKAIESLLENGSFWELQLIPTKTGK